MNRQSASATIHIHARPAAVWALVADASSWTRWAGFTSATLERTGTPTDDGVGAVRSFRRGRMGSREEVTGFEPEQRLSYRLLSGLPLRDYQADVVLRPAGDGTSVTWSSTFEPKIPGTGPLFRVVLGKLYQRLLTGLAAAAADGSPDAS